MNLEVENIHITELLNRENISPGEWLHECYLLSQALVETYAAFPKNPEHMSWSLSPFVRMISQGFFSASEEGTRKFVGFEGQTGQYAYTQEENPYPVPVKNIPEVIPESRYNFLLDGDPGFISWLKATLPWADLPLENPARAEAINARIQEILAEGEINHYGDLAFSFSNDVMQSIKGRNDTYHQFKLNPAEIGIDSSGPDFFTQVTPEQELQLREFVFQKLRHSVGEHSPYQENGQIYLDLTSATSVYEIFTNFGAMKRNTAQFTMTAASDEVLRALIFGLDEGTPPEVAEVCMRIYQAHTYSADTPVHEDQLKKFNWTPEKGFNLKLLFSVNEGWKVDHPLIMALLVNSIDDVSDEVNPELFEERYRRSCEIALGYPRECVYLIEEVIARLMTAENPDQAEKIGYKAGKDVSSALTTYQQHLSEAGLDINIVGALEDLTVENREELLPKEERIANQLKLLQMVRTHMMMKFPN
jgi:hypothetical protein